MVIDLKEIEIEHIYVRSSDEFFDGIYIKTTNDETWYYLEVGNLYMDGHREEVTFATTRYPKSWIAYHQHGPLVYKEVSLYQLMNNWHTYFDHCQGIQLVLLKQYVQQVLENAALNLTQSNEHKRAIAELHTNLAFSIQENLNGIKERK